MGAWVSARSAKPASPASPTGLARAPPSSFVVEAASPWPRRGMAGHASTLAEGVVRRAVAACQRVDPTARLSSMTADERGQTCVRLRCGDTCALLALQRALQRELPFAQARVVESVLDAYMEIALTIPTPEDEWRLARAHVARRRGPAYLILLAWVLAIVGGVDWVSTARRNRSLHAARHAAVADPKDEL